MLLDIGIRAVFYKVNTADAKMVSDAADAVMKDFGKIDILINNAGILRDASLSKVTERAFDDFAGSGADDAFNRRVMGI